MAMKNMTTDQIYDDLELIDRQWPGGVPTQQQDRVNALFGELKRREVPLKRLAKSAAKESTALVSVPDMDDEQLENEMRRLSTKLSNDASDELAQTRFADVRYEIKKRTKSSPSVQPRSIEIPDEVELTAPATKQPTSITKGLSAVAVNGFFGADGNGVVVTCTTRTTEGGAVTVSSMLTFAEAKQFAEAVLSAAGWA